MHGRRDDHQRGQQLFRNVAVTAGQQPGELQQIMADHVQLDAFTHAGVLQRVRAGAQSHDLGRRDKAASSLKRGLTSRSSGSLIECLDPGHLRQRLASVGKRSRRKGRRDGAAPGHLKRQSGTGDYVGNSGGNAFGMTDILQARNASSQVSSQPNRGQSQILTC